MEERKEGKKEERKGRMVGRGKEGKERRGDLRRGKKKRGNKWSFSAIPYLSHLYHKK